MFIQIQYKHNCSSFLFKTNNYYFFLVYILFIHFFFYSILFNFLMY